MDRLNERQEFDSAKFVEELRQLSVADQKEMDARYVWNKDGKEELSGYPGSSLKCVARVAEELKNHPDKITEIMIAVDQFLARSMGTDMVRVEGVAKRSDDLNTLWRGSEQRGDFWQKVTAVTLQKPDNGSSSEIGRKGFDAAAAVRTVL